MQRSHANTELSPELVLAVQRILKLSTEQNGDPLDDLSSDFSPAVDVLNELFPDGMCQCAWTPCLRPNLGRPRGFVGSLGCRPGEARAR